MLCWLFFLSECFFSSKSKETFSYHCKNNSNQYGEWGRVKMPPYQFFHFNFIPNASPNYSGWTKSTPKKLFFLARSLKLLFYKCQSYQFLVAGPYLEYSLGHMIKFRWWCHGHTAQKMKFSIKDFFSKYDQISSFLRILSHLMEKSLMEDLAFCAVTEMPIA